MSPKANLDGLINYATFIDATAAGDCQNKENKHISHYMSSHFVNRIDNFT